MSWLIGLSIFAIIFKAFLENKKFKNVAEQLEMLEENQVEYNYHRILPHDVKEVEISKNALDNYEITFVPIGIRQIEEKIFIIKVKGKSNLGDIAFEFTINTKFQEIKVKGTGEVIECHSIFLDLNSKEADRLLILLANIFSIEISNQSQIIKVLPLVTHPVSLSLDEILNGKIELYGDFLVNEKQKIAPKLKFEMNIDKGYFKIIELDKIYRPILINRLIFRPNIKS